MGPPPPRAVLRQVKSPKAEENKKALLKQQLLDERESQRKKKMLQREKYERELCGDYVLVYPLVSYENEFKVIDAQDPKNMGNSELIEKVRIIQQSPEWVQQQKYLLFMDKARDLWESFTQGTAVSRKRKEQEAKEKEE